MRNRYQDSSPGDDHRHLALLVEIWERGDPGRPERPGQAHDRALVLGAVEEPEGALDLDLGRGGHRADVPGIAGKRARLGRRGLRLLLQDRLVVLQEVGGVLLGRGGVAHRLGVAAAAKAAEERPPRLVARMRLGTSPAADSRIQPWCSAP